MQKVSSADPEGDNPRFVFFSACALPPHQDATTWRLVVTVAVLATLMAVVLVGGGAWACLACVRHSGGRGRRRWCEWRGRQRRRDDGFPPDHREMIELGRLPGSQTLRECGRAPAARDQSGWPPPVTLPRPVPPSFPSGLFPSGVPSLRVHFLPHVASSLHSHSCLLHFFIFLPSMSPLSLPVQSSFSFLHVPSPFVPSFTSPSILTSSSLLPLSLFVCSAFVPFVHHVLFPHVFFPPVPVPSHFPQCPYKLPFGYLE